MATVTTPPAPLLARVGTAVVAAVTGVAVVAESLPSLSRLLSPPDPALCPAVMPAPGYCSPGPHMVVVTIALVTLVVAWAGADVVLRRLSDPTTVVGISAAHAVVALLAWWSVLRPHPLYGAWDALAGGAGA